MIDRVLQESADEFVRTLEESAVVTAFQEAKALLERDREFNAIRDEHARLSERFQSKQFDGTLTEEDISNLRTTFERISKHPLNVRFGTARAETLGLLARCNEAMSSLLGFDFAANAVPASSC